MLLHKVNLILNISRVQNYELSMSRILLQIFGVHVLLFGALASLFCTSGDIPSGFHARVGCLICTQWRHAWYSSPRFTSSATPADLLAAIIVAEPISFMYLWPGIGGSWNWKRSRHLSYQSHSLSIIFIISLLETCEDLDGLTNAHVWLVHSSHVNGEFYPAAKVEFSWCGYSDLIGPNRCNLSANRMEQSHPILWYLFHF